MYMVRTILFLIVIVLFASCAEILPLTGGEEDNYAPTIVEGSQNPAQEALNVNQQELHVKFNEYFTLNDPSNTVLMNPKAGKITTTANKKELTIKWEGPMEPNTTYIIQLNGTVTDLNEKNDTVHQFVFSTGNTIDSLTIKGVLTDAFTNGAVSGAVVCLYEENVNPFETSPMYVAQTNQRGEFGFSYLKTNSYQVFAFIDKNKDRTPSKGEKIAFHSSSIAAGDTNIIALRTFLPKDTTQKLQLKLINPGLAILSGLDNIEKTTVNGSQVEVLTQFTNDSVLIALPNPVNDYLTFIAPNLDTIQKPNSERERQKNFGIQSKTYKNTWKYTDSLFFECNEMIRSIDTSKISIKDEKKQSLNYIYSINGNKLIVVPTTNSLFDFDIKIQAEAIKGHSNHSDSASIHYDTKAITDYSNLSLDLTELEGNWIIQLMDGNLAIRTFIKSETDTIVTWKHLLPNTYSVQCIEDKDKNKHWTNGNWVKKTQPETIVRFQLKSKLRPNWDIEEKLILNE